MTGNADVYSRRLVLAIVRHVGSYVDLVSIRELQVQVSGAIPGDIGLIRRVGIYSGRGAAPAQDPEMRPARISDNTVLSASKNGGEFAICVTALPFCAIRDTRT